MLVRQRSRTPVRQGSRMLVRQRSRTPVRQGSRMLVRQRPRTLGYLLFADDDDAGFDVGERLCCGEHCLAFVLLVKFAMSSAIQCKRRGVHESPFI